jgi:hypothetical protein
LTTNITRPIVQIAFKYKNLLMAESVFRTFKSLSDTRLSYYQRDEPLRGHVRCSYLALLLRKKLLDAVDKSYINDDDTHLEWDAIINDPEHLQCCEITADGKK